MKSRDASRRIGLLVGGVAIVGMTAMTAGCGSGEDKPSETPEPTKTSGAPAPSGSSPAPAPGGQPELLHAFCRGTRGADGAARERRNRRLTGHGPGNPASVVRLTDN